VQAVGTAKLSDAQRASHFRLAMANLNLGNDKIDIGSRFDYTFVGGSIGFPKPFHPTEDSLTAQQGAGNLLADFKEGTPEADLKGAPNPLRFLYKARAGTSRVDVRKYATGGTSFFANTGYTVVDIFTLRTFLSSFGDAAKPFSLQFKDLTVVADRIPMFQNGALTLNGTWIEGPVELKVAHSKERGYYVENSSIPLIRATAGQKEFVRLQHIDMQVSGAITAVADKKKTLMPLASGSMAMKTNASVNAGEAKEFAVPLVFRGCVVGSVVGTVTLVNEEEAKA
jgi:hypothetical protein